MAALFIPFGYPGYPEKEMGCHIDGSKKYLDGLGIDFVSTNNVITLKDCDEAIRIAGQQNYDYVILLIATWIEAPNMLKVISSGGLDNKPMLLWAHDNVYDPEEKAVIAFGSIAAAGVLRETFEEFGYRFKFVIGNPGDVALNRDIRAFDRAAHTARKLKDTRMGLFGYASMGMYTGLGDHIKIKKLLGTEVVHVGQYSIIKNLEQVDCEAKARQKDMLHEEWDIAAGIEESLIDKTAAITLRLRELVREHQLDALTVKCQYELSIDYGFTPCVALSLLGAEMPVSCEGDIYLLLSQIILSYISGRTTTYGDVLGFVDGGVICAACGYAPKCFLAPKRPSIHKHSALYSGLMITSPFREEDVTVIRLANRGDGFKMHLIKGRTEELRDFHEIGCPQYAGAVIKFANKDVQTFKQELMSQHYAIVEGDHAQALEDFCKLKGITIV